jgi:RimJ/RimL family protein N-acetyltransferase
VLSDTYDLAGVVTLRRLRRDLVADFAKAFMAAEADLRQWMPATATEQERPGDFVEACEAAFDAGTTFAYAIVGPGGDVAGYVNLTHAPDHAVVAYWVRPDWRGRGVAPLAVRVLTDAAFAVFPALERVHAHLDAANEASRRVLEKAGLRHRETLSRPPRTPAESDTEWLYVRDRYARGTETDRLRLRDLEWSDLDAMVPLWTDPDVEAFMDDFGPRSALEVEQWVADARHAARTAPRFRSWVMELKGSGDIVGWIGVGGSGRGVADIDFAYIVDRRHRGQGYATEALRGAVHYCFSVLGANSFWGECHTDTAPSAEAMQSAGLEFIGTVDGNHRYRISRP